MKKLLQMKFMLLLCALIVGSGTMWAADPITLWSEDFSSYSANDVPSGGTYNYSCGGANTMIYDAALAGGESPELLLQKSSNGTFTATIPLDNIEGDLTLTFKTNNQKIKVETTTNGLTGGLEEKVSGTHTATFKGVTTSTTSITIKFTCSGSSNVRLDDIVLTGTKSSGGGDTPTTWTVTYDGNGATSGSVPVDNTEYDSENSTVTVLGNTGSLAKEHYTFNNWNTADDGSGTGYAAGNTFEISANTTLYAQWAINSYNVTLPEQDQYGTYTMDATNPVDYGTEVTLTYTPAAGYENYVAKWSVNGTAIDGNKFTMPDEAVTVTVDVAEKTTADLTIDFESDATDYTDWTFTNIVSNYSNTGVNAHGGSKYGSTDGKASGSIQTKEKVNPASLTCYVSKQTTNTSTSTWYIHVSSDGSTWTEVANTDAKDMNKGEWKKFTAALSNYSDVYVRVSYSGSTAVRLIDDLTLEIKNDNRAEAGLRYSEGEVEIELKNESYNAVSDNSNPLINPNNLTDLTWSSTDETVATVSEGIVTLKAVGTTTITASFAGNDAYKPGSASFTLQVVDNRQTATVTWKDADGNNITELNVKKGDFIQGITLSCNVEGFTFTEEHLQHLWGTNETHDNYAGQQPAGYIFTPNAVWTAALGITTITATFPGNETHKPASATLTVNVTGGTETDPYTVAEAIAATPASGTTDKVYIKGIVSKFYNTSIVGDGSNYRYYISDDGTTTNQLIVYRGKGLNEQTFSSADDLQIGDKVVIYGGLTMYNNASEVASGNYIVSLLRKPTFSPEAGTYPSAQTVTISTITEGATIYYTTDGTDPTTESYIYSEPIEVNTDMTIKAIAVKDSEISTVATAEYVINLTPSIVFDGDQNPYDVPCTAGNTNIHYVASNITGTVSLVICDANGGETTYDWFRAAISSDVYVHVEWDANDTETRTAYFKLTDGTTTSEIFALTQAQYVPDYATLPFEFDGGRADIEETNGLTQDGLDSDYGSSPYLKFNSTNDYVILKINEVPGTLTFDIKGNTFSGGTFTVQTSADGENYTDLQTYTELGSTQSEEFDIAANVRYIKWIYTKKVSGNVALGNITLGNTSMAVTIAATCTDGKGKYYGTFSSSSAFVVPENLTVSEIGIDAEGKMDVQNYASGAIVPANTGVMVSAETFGNFKLVKSTEDGVDILNGANRLRPSGDDGITADEMDGKDSGCKFYRLTMHNGTQIGFWWGYENGGAFAVAANKAYMVVPADLAGARQGFGFDDATTGISNVNVNENVNGNVYDLQGRKVSTPGKGLYIVNGKKVVIK